jgi:hypothetical protein
MHNFRLSGLKSGNLEDLGEQQIFIELNWLLNFWILLTLNNFQVIV